MEDTRDLEERQERLVQLRNRAYSRLKAYPGVVDVAIGFKRVGTELTSEPSIIVLVEEKKSRSALGESELVPSEVEGIPTDVQTFTEGVPERLEPGDSLNNERSATRAGTSVGTLGFFGQVTSTQELVLISNHHVLYKNGALDGAEIGSPEHVKCFCCTCNVVAINLMGDKSIDCAMAKLKPRIKVNTVIPGIGRPVGPGVAVLGATVQKRGRTTGLTTGVVTQVTPDRSGGVFTFEVQTNGGNANFTKPGDSGAAVVDASLRIVGLHYAGCNTALPAGSTMKGCVGPVPPFFSRAIGIQRVLNFLGITILTADPANESGATHPPEEEEFIASEARSLEGDLFLKHHDEIVQLVNHDRPTLVTWHRNHGPAFLLELQRAREDPAAPLPTEVNGVSAAALVLNMLAVLEERGTPPLARDIRAHRSELTRRLQDPHEVARLAQGILLRGHRAPVPQRAAVTS